MAFGALTASFGQMVQNPEVIGHKATYPPRPAPGRTEVDNYAYIGVYKNPMDRLYLQSWPDQIEEGIQTQWQPLTFSGASAPLAAIYRGNTWDNYQVVFKIHASNASAVSDVDPVTLPLVPAKQYAMSYAREQIPFPLPSVPDQNALPFSALASRSTPQQTIDRSRAMEEIMKIQLQIAWCKSVCLPKTGELNKEIRNTIQQTQQSEDFEDALNSALEGAKRTLEHTKKALQSIADGGMYSGEIFPPLLETQYGNDWLKLYGFPESLRITYLPPFAPGSGYPHRADIVFSFIRFFPEELPTRNGMRYSALGRMG